MDQPRRLLYFSPESYGGLADYAHEQARALQEAGVETCFLTTPEATLAKPESNYARQTVLTMAPNKAVCPSKIVRRFRAAKAILGNIRMLAGCARKMQVRHVLFGGYFEYLAPLWAPRLRALAQSGMVFGSVVHDPLRNFVVGPVFWHRWSTACGYSFLREAFVHEPIELPTVRPQPQLRTTVIPHGPYRFAPATESRGAMRQRLRIPDSAQLLLAFGHIRDAKNLDLVLKAMAGCPEFYLVVAGRELGAAQRPASHYEKLAGELGVADRCRWEIRHIEENEIANFFTAADLVLLTYNSEFRSASGVLNAAAQFRKPCLASSGKSNLQSVVEKYRLGFWIEPDSSEAIARGLNLWLRGKLTPAWSEYSAANSWRRNSELVIERMYSAWDFRGQGVGARSDGIARAVRQVK